ncbi:MAG: hypothetical protein WDW36_000341 [Sanguina aurantia]
MPPVAALSTRPIQLVVWGATGFTGRLVCEHLARDYQGKVKWAIAGRNAARLEEVKQELIRINPSCKDTPVLIGDIKDEASIGRILQQAQVVVSTAGPFAAYGDVIVDQALAQGTHYCDITGEIPWVRDSAAKRHEAAKAKGVKLVHCCGYDSTPTDLGVLMMVEYARQKYSAGLDTVYNLVGDCNGSISGGTIASALLLSSLPPATLGKLASDSYFLAGVHGAPSGTDRPAPFKPVYVKEGGTWTMPFFMSPVNSQIAHYSDALTSHSYGKDFHVLEVMALGSGWSGYLKAWLGTGLMGIAAALVFVKMLRPIADRILPVPGQGPSMKLQRELGHWEHNLVAVTEGPNPKIFKGKVEDAKRDPGYWGTSRMVLEAGLCLVEDAEKLKEAGYAAGGVLTPATAMGTVLITRLQAAGIRFEVTERG